MNYTDPMGMESSPWVSVSVCERKMSAEVSGEVTLSDDQVEIRRVLAVNPTVLSPAKYVGGSGIELSGTVDYTVLYLGADGELYSLPMSSEYHLNLPIDTAVAFDPGAGVTVWADVMAESVSFRVASPRKMSVRCRLRTQVRAFGKRLMEEKMIGESCSEQLFRRTATAKNLLVANGLSEVISLSCEFSGIGEDARVISADATPIVSEARIDGETAHLSGEVILRLLVGHEGGRPTVLSRNLPLSGELEMESTDAPDECRATGTVSEISVEMGEDGKILCDVSVLLEVRGMRNQEVVYTADLFSGEQESLCEVREERLPIALRCEHRNFSQSERIPLSELSLPEGCVILDALGSVLFDGCEQIDQKYVLSGESKYLLLCERDGEYSCVDVKLPIRYEAEGGEEVPESFSARGAVISCRARVDGEMLSIDSEIDVVADFIGSEEISAVHTVRFGNECSSRNGRMTVYYPAPTEDAWAVAKKYHLSPEKIAKGTSYYYF